MAHSFCAAWPYAIAARWASAQIYFDEVYNEAHRLWAARFDLALKSPDSRDRLEEYDGLLKLYDDLKPGALALVGAALRASLRWMQERCERRRAAGTTRAVWRALIPKRKAKALIRALAEDSPPPIEPLALDHAQHAPPAAPPTPRLVHAVRPTHIATALGAAR
jgi:hypothetical protein